MRKYEILLLLKPNLEDAVKTATITLVEELIGGKIVKKDEWGLKKLSYPILKQVEADYILYYVETESSNIIELKKRINIVKEIMRAMILVHEKGFPFEKVTSSKMTFPQRKPRTFNKKYESSDRKDVKQPSSEEEVKNVE